DLPRPDAEVVAEPEQERRERRIPRVPPAEDDGGERDEALAGAHLAHERADAADRERRPAEPRDESRDRDRPEPHAVDLDADRVGGERMLAERPHPKAPPGLEENVPGERHE